MRGALPERLARPLRYVLTGGTAALVDLGGFALLLILSLPLALAGTISFLAALGVNYYLSSRYVFHVTPDLRRLPLFALGAGLGLCINMGVTIILAGLGTAPLLAKAVGIGVAFVFNYSVNLLVVYRR